MQSSKQSYRSSGKPIVFFDGACPLCSKEIKHYRGLPGANHMEWIDVSEPELQLSAYGISQHEAMQVFHVLDANGVWQRGAYGFAEVWRHLRFYKLLTYVFKIPGLLPTLNYFYHRFASWRFSRRCDSNCDIASISSKR